ncbi:MAG: SMP-30/gluconolactonase/LRE family protein [Acidobacteria bacterium]|nr:SMP-30/gluconolactonase/LRE family protein [Acidobacteriota bacterium]
MAQYNSLDDVMEAGAQVEKVLSDFAFTEGPVFSRIGFMLFSDIPRNRIMKYVPGRPVETFRENSNGANGLTFDHQGRLLACEGGAGRVTRTEKNGAITVLADKFEGKALNAPNDIVYCIDGNIYFSDLRRRNEPADSGKVEFSAVYQITRKGELRVAARELKRPNGVALSSNQQILYVADTEGRSVHAYDLTPDGSLARGRLFAETAAGPDGLKTDEGGNVYVATAEGVQVFNSEGRLLGIIRVPENPANAGWGDNYRTLYITARTSLYKVRLKVSGTRTF